MKLFKHGWGCMEKFVIITQTLFAESQHQIYRFLHQLRLILITANLNVN
jgi:hypothetical protein